MKDREMLELAAKAGGISGYRYSENFYCMAHWNESDGGWFDCGLWDPLRNDGDALRLAVRLRMTVDIYSAMVEVSWHDDIASETFVVTEHDNNADNDLSAATRRAITCAAAHIGKEMK